MGAYENLKFVQITSFKISYQSTWSIKNKHKGMVWMKIYEHSFECLLSPLGHQLVNPTLSVILTLQKVALN